MNTFDATQTYNGVDVTSAPIPITATTGNLLLIFASNYNGANQTLNTPAGWTKLADATTNQIKPSVFAKVSDGTEGATVALTTGSGSNAFDCSAVSYSISGWAGSLANVSVAAFAQQASSASINSVDPAVVTAAWGAEANNLWITAGFAARANKPFTVKPTGYANFTDVTAGPDGAGFYAFTSVGYKVANAASDDPSVFTAGTYQNMAAVTIVVRSGLANIDPTLDTAQDDVTIQEGQVGTITADFSDQNTGDTLTYGITPDITLVTGFSFSTVTGTISYSGSQVAASAVSYTRTADDGNGGTPASDTFTITVIPPQLSIDSVSDSTPEAGSSITLTVSNKAGTITASCPAGALTITAQDATTVTLTVPVPPDFGDKSLNFESNVVITLDDGSVTDTTTIQIQVPVTELFAQIAELDSLGIYANDTDIAIGDYAHAKAISTGAIIDLATGLYAFPGGAGSFEYSIYDVTDGLWSPAYAPVSAEDTEPPVITLNGANPLPHVQGAPWVDPGATVTDNFDTTRTISADNEPDIAIPGTYTLNYNAMDAAGNVAAQVTRTVDVVAYDDIPNDFPFTAQTGVARSVYATSNAITVLGIDSGRLVPVTVTGGEYSVSTDNGQTWGAWTTTSTNVLVNYQLRVRHTTAATYSTPESTTLTIGVTESTFTSTTLADTVAPVITITGGNPVIMQYDEYDEPGYSATDNADGDITFTGVVVTGSVNTDVPSTYVLTYTATDAAGNSSSTTRVVTVTPYVASDSTPPVISLIGGNRSVEEGSTWVDPGYTATDNVDGNITTDVVITGTVNTAVPGAYTLTYTVEDATGNTTVVTRTVVVTPLIVYPILVAAPASRTFNASRFNRIESGDAVFVKQPNEILDFDFDLTDWLDEQEDTLPDGNVSVDAGTSLEVKALGVIPGTSRVKVWLEGGDAGSNGTAHTVELTIITAGYRRAQFLFRLVVVDR